MRGFSNRPTPQAPIRQPYRPPAVQPRPFLDAEQFDFSRYAPERPRIASSNSAISGELGMERPIAMSWDLAKRNFAQGFRCLWNIKRVIATRAKLRGKVAFHRIVQNRLVPWALAGWGWGWGAGGWGVVLVLVMR